MLGTSVPRGSHINILIGQSIANYIVESKKDKLLNELLHIVKRNKEK